MNTTVKNIFDLACVCAKAQAAQIPAEPETKICPVCGSNILQHEAGLLLSEDWSGLHQYYYLNEPGWYRCKNGHEFRTTIDNNGFIQII